MMKARDEGFPFALQLRSQWYVARAGKQALDPADCVRRKRRKMCGAFECKGECRAVGDDRVDDAERMETLAGPHVPCEQHLGCGLSRQRARREPGATAIR